MQRLGLIEMVVLTALATLTAVGCPGGDDSTDSGAGSTTNTASSTAATASTEAEGTTEPATSAGTMGGSGSGSTSMAADTTTGSVGPVMCAESMCETGQVCVHPCGGGAQPPCEPADGNGACPPGYIPDQDGLCPGPCEGGACCAPEPEDLTPFCLGTEELMCDGTMCEAPGCVAGELQDGQLQCGCPP